MPLVRTEILSKGSAWALWHIDESEEELAFTAMESCPDDIVAPLKRKEYLAGRALVRTLIESEGLTYLGLRKDDNGKPFLKDSSYEISLSHSSPYVAAQIHSSKPVGIDVEQPKEKLLRIASRVMSPVEEKNAGQDPVKHCVYWCAKEVMYKIHGKGGLAFSSQLNIEPFVLERSGDLKGRITGDKVEDVTLSYIVKSDHVLVYTKHEL